ncbi:MAG TPA: hypothetical protein VJT67_14380 [Longimicrobiaceae bacterium]|nr:hypothetical protein [Longimicrobiaceae bacterium]
MKIRFAFIAAVLAASAACSASPTAVDRDPRAGARRETTPPPPDTITSVNFGGGMAGSGS